MQKLRLGLFILMCMAAGSFAVRAVGVLPQAHTWNAALTREAEVVLPAPFAAGEKLEFEVGWNNFLTAATVQLQIPEKRDFYGHTAWHFQARARTIDPVRFLYPLEDQFDSYSDEASFRSLQFEMYLNEKNNKETHIIRMRTEGEAAQDGKPVVRVLAGTRDPLGALYALRAVDWPRVTEVRMPVFDGRKLYELRGRPVGARSGVSVSAGTFSATKISLQVFESGRETGNIAFTLWLANDRQRTPVQIEALLPFGTLSVGLARREL